MPYIINDPIEDAVQVQETKIIRSYLIEKEIFVITPGKERIEIKFRKGYDNGIGGTSFSTDTFDLILEGDEVKSYFLNNGDVYQAVRSASYQLLADSFGTPGNLT